MTDFPAYLRALVQEWGAGQGERGEGIEAFIRTYYPKQRRLFYRWLRGDVNPRGPTLMKLMDELGGDFRHATNLIGGAAIERAGEEDAHLFMTNRPPQPGGGRKR